MQEETSFTLENWEVIRETYTIVGYLGEGTFGQVYKVRHRFLGMQALKMFRPGIFDNAQEGELFYEPFILSKITHPNVVRVFDANAFSRHGREHYFISMEYVRGNSLDRLVMGKDISLSVALKLACDICDGLGQAHSKSPPIVHRDIKPQNILIENEGDALTAKVSDFGLARHVNPETKLINAAGTLPFMAPEGYWNSEGPASDVFSAGIVLYWLLTRAFPFEIPGRACTNTEKDLQNVVVKSRLKKPQPPSIINKKINPELSDIVMKALEFEAGLRFQTACELGASLRGACQRINVVQHAQTEAAGLANDALRLGQQFTGLPDAVLKMETAFSKDASLIPKYGPLVDQWRRGILL